MFFDVDSTFFLTVTVTVTLLSFFTLYKAYYH